MKPLLTFLCSLVFFHSFAAIKSTVSDGSWFDDANWSPAGVPLMEDTVLINHNITVSGDYVDFGANWLIISSSASIFCDTTFGLHGNLKIYGTMEVHTFGIGDGDSTIIFGTVSGGKYVPSNPANVNYGMILSDSLILGDSFDNFGLIDVLDMIIGESTFINHSGSAIHVSGQLTVSGVSVNEANSTIVTGALVTGENLTNDGDISTVTWTHGTGTVNGSTGKFCVAECFMNTSDISGTIDICDATPAGFCDFDFGTIAGTVTFCAVGSCGDNVGIEQTEKELAVYPNPVRDYVTIANATTGDRWELLDVRGSSIQSGTVISEETILNVTDLGSGVYFLKMYGVHHPEVVRLMKD